MKRTALVLAVMLPLVLLAPALAQPFADVPTEQWAYDAIAELAAKGLIEGYPDGAFRGHRAMTRYEMSMVVARLLARIEAIKIPPLPSDLVRAGQLNTAVNAHAGALRATDQRLQSSLSTIQRLVAEFRAELATLGMRVTAVEEELAVIRARLDKTRVTGDYRTRYTVFPVGSVSGGSTRQHPDARVRLRLTFNGKVNERADAVVRLLAANNAGCRDTSTGLPAGCSSSDVPFGSNYNFGIVSFDLVHLNIRGNPPKDKSGDPLWIVTVGRQAFALNDLGPVNAGLLYAPQSLGASTVLPLSPAPLVVAAAGVSDGVLVQWNPAQFKIKAAIFRDAVLMPPVGVAPGSGSSPAIDHRIVQVSHVGLPLGLTLAGAYYQAWQHPTVTGSNVSGGIGWEVAVFSRVAEGDETIYLFYANAATWQSIPAVGANPLPAASAWRVGGRLKLAGAGFPASLDFGYMNYGPLPLGALPPAYTFATTGSGQAFAWNMRGWLAQLTVKFGGQTRGIILYEGGTVLCTVTPCGSGSTTAPYSEWQVRLEHLVERAAGTTTFTLAYGRGTTSPAVAGIASGSGDYFNTYRAELVYSWPSKATREPQILTQP